MKSDKALWGSISILIGAVIAILALIRGGLADMVPDRGIHPLGAVGCNSAFTAVHAAGETPQDA